MHLLQGSLVLVFCFSGIDPDFTNMFFIPKEGQTHSCDTSQVCWAAGTRHTNFLLSKATGKASLRDLVWGGPATAGKPAGGSTAQGEGSPWTWRGWQVVASEEDKCGHSHSFVVYEVGWALWCLFPHLIPCLVSGLLQWLSW